MKKQTVQVINLSTNEIINCDLDFVFDDIHKIILYCNNDNFSAEANDLYEALQKIREQLNKNNMDILVNGSRKNIICSPMMRDMSQGSSVYIIRPRITARPEDIVSTFDPIEKEDLATIDEQRIFQKKWKGSLKPTQGEINEAKKHPNGWVYRIDGDFSDEDDIPPEAIIGAWEVNSKGDLTGIWKGNKNFIPVDKR
jgi:hypothetical protein